MALGCPLTEQGFRSSSRAAWQSRAGSPWCRPCPSRGPVLAQLGETSRGVVLFQFGASPSVVAELKVVPFHLEPPVLADALNGHVQGCQPPDSNWHPEEPRRAHGLGLPTPWTSSGPWLGMQTAHGAPRDHSHLFSQRLAVSRPARPQQTPPRAQVPVFSARVLVS